MHAIHDQSHKAATHLAMLTRLVSFNKMKGCCSNSRGYGLSVPLLIRLPLLAQVQDWADDLPFIHEILNPLGPDASNLGVVLHRGYRCRDDI